VPWWLAGGAPAPVAVFQPKGAASLAASYINLVNPGTYDATAPVTAPTLDATGWVFASNAWLDTGITLSNPSSGWSAAVQFANVGGANQAPLLGVQNDAGTRSFGLRPYRTTGVVTYDNSYFLNVSPQLAAGTIGIAGNQGYRNGTADGGTVSYFSWTPFHTIYIASAKNSSAQVYLPCSIAAAVIWNTSTGHATWMPAVHAAMAAL
jgi:hypothetical protein